MTMTMNKTLPILDVQNVSKSFTLHNIDGRTVTALEDASFVVYPGEHVSLAGSSGAGKSTLLRLIYRTYSITAGSVKFRLTNDEWVDIAKLSDAEVIALRGREIGYVSQFLHT